MGRQLDGEYNQRALRALENIVDFVWHPWLSRRLLLKQEIDWRRSRRRLMAEDRNRARQRRIASAEDQTEGRSEP
jgi:hypothetical protein